MKFRYIFLFLLVIPFIGFSQSKPQQLFHYSLQPKEPNPLLDSVSNSDISYALSLRKLKRNYAGFCLKVRRASDNAEMNIGFNGDGLIDTNAIITFKGTSNIFVNTWYDQTGLGRDAIQTVASKQPQLLFESHRKFPVIKFDGSNDALIIDTSVLVLTNNGVEGSVFYVGNTTNRNQTSFGSFSATNGSNRWSSHISWGNNNVYFDPGFCCNNPRNFNNTTRRDSFDQYSFIRSTTNSIIRQNSVQRINGTYSNANCTVNIGFGIGAGYNGNTISHSNNSFLEIIMYKKEVSGTDLTLIENNQVSYWDI